VQGTGATLTNCPTFGQESDHPAWSRRTSRRGYVEHSPRAQRCYCTVRMRGEMFGLGSVTRGEREGATASRKAERHAVTPECRPTHPQPDRATVIPRKRVRFRAAIDQGSKTDVIRRRTRGEVQLGPCDRVLPHNFKLEIGDSTSS